MSIFEFMKYITIFIMLISISLSFAQESDRDRISSFNISSDFQVDDAADLDLTHVLRARGNERSGSWTIYVTLRHDDTGWDHYADRWQVLDSTTGEVLGERILMHPHETEQPFTRSLSGIFIPETVESIIIRGACTVHGFGGTEVTVDLKLPSSAP